MLGVARMVHGWCWVVHGWWSSSSHTRASPPQAHGGAYFARFALLTCPGCLLGHDAAVSETGHAAEVHGSSGSGLAVRGGDTIPSLGEGEESDLPGRS